MTTERQKEANARNATLSTGPRTEEGRATSARNSLKHGLSSKSYLLPHEDPEEFKSFLADATETYQPANRQEAELVFQLANCALRLRRLARAEASALSGIPLEVLCSASPQTIRNLALHEGTIRRTMSSLETRLEKLQAARRRREAEQGPIHPMFEAGMVGAEESR